MTGESLSDRDTSLGWRTLSELSRAIASYHSAESLFHDLAGRLHDLLNFTYLSVVLYEADVNRMRVWQIEGAAMPPYSDRRRIPLDESPSARVWRTQQPLIIADTLLYGDYPGIRQILAGVNVRSFLSLPLTTVQRRLGALNFGNAIAHTYDGLDLELPLLVAAHVAVAVDNVLHADAARALQDSLQARNKELLAERQRLDEIVRELPGVVWEIRGTPGSPESVLSLLNDASRDLIGIDAASLVAQQRRLLARIHRDDWAALVRHARSCHSGARVDPLLVRCWHANGEIRWVELRSTPMHDEKGMIVGLRGIATDVTTRIQFEAERRRHVAELATERLQERERIAADLHDTLLQSAVGSSLQLRALTGQVPSDQPHLRARLEETLNTFEGTIAEGRRAVQGLRSTDGAVDLVAAIRRTVSQLQRERSIELSFEANAPAGTYDSSLVTGVARIAGEALTNAHRHSRATHIHVRIEHRASAIEVLIADDGVGIDPLVAIDGKPGHAGIPTMRERAELLGGRLTVNGGKHGTTVEIVIPMRPPL